MAVPHVAATAALISARAAGPRSGARGDRAATRDARHATSGAPGYDQLYGSGLLNAAAATAPPAPAPSRPTLGRPDDQDRAGRVVRHLVRHASQQETLGAGHALVADHDQVGVLLLGHVQDRVRRLALAREGVTCTPAASTPRAASARIASTSSLGVDRVLDVARAPGAAPRAAATRAPARTRSRRPATPRSSSRARSPRARPAWRSQSRPSRPRCERTSPLLRGSTEKRPIIYVSSAAWAAAGCTRYIHLRPCNASQCQASGSRSRWRSSSAC